MNSTTLNTTINNLTAFRTWEEMEAKLKEGYCPTIKPKTKAAKALILTIQVLGYRVWTGQ